MAEAKGRAIGGRLELIRKSADEEAPRLRIIVKGAAGKQLAATPVDADGSFSLPARVRDEAARAYIGPVDVDPDEEPDRFMVYRLGDLERQLELGPIPIPLDRWLPWWPWSCVSGSVRRCFPFPHWLSEIAVNASIKQATIGRFAGTSAGAGASLGAGFSAVSPILPEHVFFLWRCGTVCQGVVEVYRRVCCCQPPIIFEPPDPPIEWEEPPIPIPDPPWPIPEPDPPFPPFPPGPGPDPAPFDALEAVATAGALDVRKLNVQRDAVMARSLKGRAHSEFLRLRPWLWCTCGGATKVAQGLIADDGTFSICWSGWPPFFTHSGCSVKYAYKVSQPIGSGGASVTIYDGVAAGQWFNPGDNPTLTSYSPWARTCAGDPEIPGTGDAIVLLHEIGATEAHHLATPNQDTPDSIVAPTANSGLLDASGTDGPSVNRPLGGRLGLRYFFSAGTKGIGARFFRVQVSRADASGDPVGGWTTVPVPTWSSWRWTGSAWLHASHALGPNADGLYVIPYEDVDLLGPLEEWDPDQYHAVLDSTGIPDGRHLVRIEVFDNGGNQIKPTGATGPGTARAFRFGLWRIPAGPPDNVPFSALTHLLWTDNRSAVAQIAAIRLGTVPSSATCQFLEGPAGAGVSFDIRAYHPSPGAPQFLMDHSLWVQKGLGGPVTNYIVNAFGEVGEPPAAPSTSPSQTLGTLLGADTKCAFAVRLTARVKTTNGAGRLTELDDDETAAFAAQKT